MMDDLISRAAAIKEIEPIKYCGDFISALIHLPAVDAVPVVHARWIPYKTPSGRETIFERCSACKQPTLVTRETPYCPWCGAKMDGEQEDSDGAD